MEPARRIVPRRACENARALASLALDERLDDLSARWLSRHLETCAECATVVAEIEQLVTMLRAAALEPLARAVPTERREGSPARARRAPWAATAAGVAALVVAIVSLPHASTSSSPLRPVVVAVHVPTWSAAPVRLPIGQRSAASDFAAGPRLLSA